MTPYNPPSLDSDDTVYSADSIEFCPFQSLANFVACGTYQLSKDESEADTVETTQTTEEPSTTAADDSDDDEEEVKPEKPMLRLGRLLVYDVQGSSDGSRKL
jgi:diphthamide biosynthesis protein 7